MPSITEIPIRNPFPPPENWTRREIPEQLSTHGKVDAVILDFVLKSTPSLSAAIDRSIGRGVMGTVLGREDEDTEIEIDERAEDFERRILTQAARKYNLPLFVFSEHNHFAVGKTPEVVAALDPIDNSGQYQEGLDTPLYVALGFFDLNGNPLGAASINLVNRHIYINRQGRNYFYNPNLKTLIELPEPKKVKSISEKLVFVTYSGKYKYSRPFNRNFEIFERERHRDSLRDGIAGAHMYGAKVATGAVSLYLMFGEPISEVIQGLPFIKTANCIAASINPEEGTWEEYKFEPRFYLENPDRYNTDRIPFFIMASTRELLHEAIRYGFTKPLPGFDRF